MSGAIRSAVQNGPGPLLHYAKAVAIRTAAVHISSVAMLICTAALHISSVAMLIRRAFADLQLVPKVGLIYNYP